MQFFILIIICTVAFIDNSLANAGEIRDDRNKLYLGINAGSYQEVLDESTPGLSFQLGYDLHKFFAIESHLGLTYNSIEESDGVNSGSAKALLSYASIYLRGNLPFDNVTLFALAGYTYLRGDFETVANFPSLNINEKDEFSETDNDISYGAGIDLYGNGTTAMSFKWVRIIDFSDGAEIDAYLLGITHYFKN